MLVGFMGAGKSSVGKLLAAELGLPFVDTDALIEERAGASIQRIFAASGERGFRREEKAAIKEVLAGPDAVVALGGGALQDPTVRALVQAETVVHLDVELEEAMSRIGTGTGRPMLQQDPTDLYQQRDPVYRAVGKFTVATRGSTPHEIAKVIAERLESW